MHDSPYSFSDNCWRKVIRYYPEPITQAKKDEIIKEYLENKYKTWEVMDKLGNIHKVHADASATEDDITLFWQGNQCVARFSDAVYSIQK